MSVNWRGVEQPLRIVVQIFRDMSLEEKAKLQENHHVLFFNLEDLDQMVALTDENRRCLERQRDGAKKALEGWS